jgi:lysozyme family protein
MDFKTAFKHLVRPDEEGAYSNHPKDRGGPTMYGVTERVARRHGYTGDMKDLPLDLAERIYLEDYWGPAGCDAVPDNMKYPLFSFYVNAPPKAAIRALQIAAELPESQQDGVMGPKTLMAVNSANAKRLEFRFSAAKNLYYTGLTDWPAFGRGWIRREALNVLARGV